MKAFGKYTITTGEYWIIPADLFGNGPLSQWIGQLPKKLRTVHVSELITTNEESQLLKGTISEAWPLPASKRAELNEIKIEIEAGNSGSFSIRSLSGNFKSGSYLIPLTSETNAGDELLMLRTTDAANAILLLTENQNVFEGKTLPYIFRAGAESLLPEFLKPEMQIALLRAGSPAVSYLWTANLPDISIGGKQLPLRDLSLRYRVQVFAPSGEDDDDETESISSRFSQSFIMQGKLKLGADYNFICSVPLQGLSSLSISPADEATGFPGPAGLLRLIGMKDEADAVDAALKNVPILNSLQVRNLRFRIDLAKKRLAGFDLGGIFTLGGSEFNFSFAWPFMRFNVNLSRETPIELGKISAALFPDTAGFDLQTQIDRLEFTIQATDFSVSSSIRLKDVWKFNPTGNKSAHSNFIFESVRIQSSLGKNTSPQISLSTRWKIAGIDLELEAETVSANGKKGWRLRTIAAEETKISLRSVVTEIARLFAIPAPDHFPEIELGSIEFEINTADQSLLFRSEASLAKPLGEFKTSAVQLEFSVSRDEKEKRVIRLRLNGDLDIAGSQLKFNADLSNKDWKLNADWEKGTAEVPNLFELVKLIDKNFNSNSVPEHFKEALTPAALSFSFESSGPRFMLKGKTAGGHQIIIQLVKSTTGSGIVFGIGYKNPSDVPEFGGLIKNIQLENAWLFFSKMPGTNQSELKFDDTDLPVNLNELGNKLAFAAKLSVKQQKTEAFNNLEKITGVNEFRVLGAIAKKDGKTSALLELAFTGVLKIYNGKNDFITVKNVKLKLEAGTSGFSITAGGTIEVPFDQYMIDATVEISLSEKALELRGMIEETKNDGIPVFGLRNVKLKKAALSAGITFVPPQVTLGIMGSMYFRENQKVPEQMAVKFGIAGAVVKPEYFLLDITHIDLADLLRAIESNQKKRNLIPDKLLGAEAFSFYYSAQDDNTLPDGRTINAGTGFHGLLNIGDWHAFLAFKAERNLLSAEGALDPVDYPGFKLKGDGKGYSMKGYYEGKVWRPISNSQAAALPSRIKIESNQVIKPGGAIVHVNSIDQPYLAANIKINLLNIVDAQTKILIDNNGLKFKLHLGVKYFFNLNLEANFQQNEELLAKGDVFAGLDVKIPVIFDKIQVRLGFEGNVNLRAGRDRFQFDFYYGFTILGIEIPGLQLNIPRAPKNFEDAFNMVRDNFLKNILDGLIGRLITAILKPVKGKNIPSKLHQQLASRKPGDDNLTKLKELSDLFEHEKGSKFSRNEDPVFLRNREKLDAFIKNISSESRTEIERLAGLNKDFIAISRAKLKVANNAVDMTMQELENAVNDIGAESKQNLILVRRYWESFETKREETMKIITFSWQERFKMLLQKEIRTGMTREAFRKSADQLADEFFKKLLAHMKNMKNTIANRPDTVRYFFDLVRINKESKLRIQFINDEARIKIAQIAKPIAKNQPPHNHTLKTKLKAVKK